MPERELPDLDELDEIDGYWLQPTTITVNRLTKARLNEMRNNQPWNEFLEELRRAKADPLTLSDVESITDAIREDLSMAPEHGVDEQKIVARVCKRLDDLEAELPKKVAQEVRNG